MKIIFGLVLFLAFPVFAQAPPEDVEGRAADCETCNKTIDKHQAVDVPYKMQETANAMELEVFGNKGDAANGNGTKGTN